MPDLVLPLGRTNCFAPLVVMQILAGIAHGPGVLGSALPDYYRFDFVLAVLQLINGPA